MSCTVHTMSPLNPNTFYIKHYLHKANTNTNSSSPSSGFNSKPKNRFPQKLVLGASTENCTENLILIPIYTVLTTNIRETNENASIFSQIIHCHKNVSRKIYCQLSSS
jgi:hypothetical protein